MRKERTHENLDRKKSLLKKATISETHKSKVRS
nr:MAG TPA: hypothetical protein [Bacteriophage sp.]